MNWMLNILYRIGSITERMVFVLCRALVGGCIGAFPVLMVGSVFYEHRRPSEQPPLIILNILLGLVPVGTAIGGAIGYFEEIPKCRKFIRKYKCVNQERLELTGWEGNVPEEFNDPIDFQLMDKPIKTRANNFKKIYDIRTLNNLVSTESGKPMCPFSRQPITILAPDFELQRKINMFVQEKIQAKEMKEAEKAKKIKSKNSELLRNTLIIPFFAKVESPTNLTRRLVNNQENAQLLLVSGEDASPEQSFRIGQ